MSFFLLLLLSDSTTISELHVGAYFHQHHGIALLLDQFFNDIPFSVEVLPDFDPRRMHALH